MRCELSKAGTGMRKVSFQFSHGTEGRDVTNVDMSCKILEI